MFTKGDHIVTPLTGPLTHHGIYISDEEVVHWTSGRLDNKTLWDAGTRKSESLIKKEPLDRFRNGRAWAWGYPACFEPDQVVDRALSRVGEDNYHLLFNNCEHFATWCRTDKHQSNQADAAAISAGRGTGGLVGRAAREPVVRNTARTFILRAAPAAGLVGLAAVGVGASVLVVDGLFPTPPADTEPVRGDSSDGATEPNPPAATADRDATLVGRAAGTAAGVTTGLCSIGAVAAAGVPGLSAVGVTTGLTAIGGTVAGGLAVTFGAPIAAAVAAGYLGYWLWRR